MLETHVLEAKKQLRRSAREAREAIAPAAAAGAADAAAHHFLTAPACAAARTVALYAPIRGELHTAPLARILVGAGVRVAYPRVVAAEKQLAFHEVEIAGDGRPMGLYPGRFALFEPPADAASVSLDAIDLFVVPGLAFDPTGARLGWGQGYYDHTLARAPVAVRVGYCYACQIVPEVPHGPGDVAMDLLVCEDGAGRTDDDRGRSAGAGRAEMSGP